MNSKFYWMILFSLVFSTTFNDRARAEIIVEKESILRKINQQWFLMLETNVPSGGYTDFKAECHDDNQAVGLLICKTSIKSSHGAASSSYQRHVTQVPITEEQSNTLKYILIISKRDRSEGSYLITIKSPKLVNPHTMVLSSMQLKYDKEEDADIYEKLGDFVSQSRMIVDQVVGPVEVEFSYSQYSTERVLIFFFALKTDFPTLKTLIQRTAFTLKLDHYKTNSAVECERLKAAFERIIWEPRGDLFRNMDSENEILFPSLSKVSLFCEQDNELKGTFEMSISPK